MYTHNVVYSLLLFGVKMLEIQFNCIKLSPHHKRCVWALNIWSRSKITPFTYEHRVAVLFWGVGGVGFQPFLTKYNGK